MSAVVVGKFIPGRWCVDLGSKFPFKFSRLCLFVFMFKLDSILAIIIMTALPSLDACGLHGTGLSLWHTLLQAENTALNDPSRTKAKYNDPLIGIRLLGFFLKDFWDHAHDGYLGSNPYARMVTEITSCLNKPDDKAAYDALVELGLRYRNHLLRVCEWHDYLPRYPECTKHLPVRSNTGGRPTPSRHVSRPSFDVVKGRILEELGNAPQTKPNVRKQVHL